MIAAGADMEKPGSLVHNIAFMKIIPANDVIADLERKAAECEARAESEAEPAATQLKEEANRIRAWITDLKTRKWTS